MPDESEFQVKIQINSKIILIWGYEVLLSLIGTYASFHNACSDVAVCLQTGKCQPCLYRVCNCCIWGLNWISFSIFSPYLCCSGLDGEQIYRPCPYRIRRALFLQLCRAMLAWLWRRVTVRDVRRRKSAKWKRDLFFPFLFFFSLSFPLLFYCVFCCPTCLCTRHGGTARTGPAAIVK